MSHSHPHLGTNCHNLVGVDLKQVKYLLSDPVHVRPRKVDLVQDREYLQVVREGEVEVGDGLGLNPLNTLLSNNFSVSPAYLT